MSKVAYWLAYPVLWLFHPALIKLRYQTIKGNRALKRQFWFCVTLAATPVVLVILWSFSLFGAHLMGDITGQLEKAIITGNAPEVSVPQRSLHEERPVLPPTPVANETVYETPETLPALDTQSRIDALKREVKDAR